MAAVPTIEVEEITRDVPCRAFEVVLHITWRGSDGYYTFTLSDLGWCEARNNPKRIADGDHGPHLFVEKLETANVQRNEAAGSTQVLDPGEAQEAGTAKVL